MPSNIQRSGIEVYLRVLAFGLICKDYLGLFSWPHSIELNPAKIPSAQFRICTHNWCFRLDKRNARADSYLVVGIICTSIEVNYFKTLKYVEYSRNIKNVRWNFSHCGEERWNFLAPARHALEFSGTWLLLSFVISREKQLKISMLAQ